MNTKRNYLSTKRERESESEIETERTRKGSLIFKWPWWSRTRHDLSQEFLNSVQLSYRDGRNPSF